MFNYDYIFISFGELTTKGKNRIDFVKILASNIRRSFKKNDFDLEVTPKFDYMLVDIKNILPSKYQKLNNILGSIFGISNFSYGFIVNTNITEITNICRDILNNSKFKSFAFHAKRNWKGFEMNSVQVKQYLAKEINSEHKFNVDNVNPNLWIRLIISKKATVVKLNKIKGLDGLPTGSNGNILMLLSGGIDSPVASYMLMKRGFHVDYLHFTTPPITVKKSVEKVFRLVKILSKYNSKSSLVYKCNFTSLQNEISHISTDSYRITIMRRMFYRFAEKYAVKNRYDAIATGEALGQVASQTTQSLSCVNDVVSILVLRPLITYNKNEIIDIAKKIQTYETSILNFSDCCSLFVPKKPVTKPKVEVCNKIENEIFWNEILNSLSLEIIKINSDTVDDNV